jgi:hypothetical protein
MLLRTQRRHGRLSIPAHYPAIPGVTLEDDAPVLDEVSLQGMATSFDACKDGRSVTHARGERGLYRRHDVQP